MKKLGMKGALINGYTNVKDSEHGLYLDDESMLVFWDKVNELNVPVYLHPREPLEGPARGIYTGYESLIGSARGFAQETAVHAIRLMMSGLFDRYLTSIWCWVTSAKGWYICCRALNIVSIVSVSAAVWVKRKNR